MGIFAPCFSSYLRRFFSYFVWLSHNNAYFCVYFSDENHCLALNPQISSHFALQFARCWWSKSLISHEGRHLTGENNVNCTNRCMQVKYKTIDAAKVVQCGFRLPSLTLEGTTNQEVKGSEPRKHGVIQVHIDTHTHTHTTSGSPLASPDLKSPSVFISRNI